MGFLTPCLVDMPTIEHPLYAQVLEVYALCSSSRDFIEIAKLFPIFPVDTMIRFFQTIDRGLVS